MKQCLGLIWTVVAVIILQAIKAKSFPSATFCRICDSQDRLARDDCYQTYDIQHRVCSGKCLTQFSMTSAGLRVQKSCVDDAFCISEWWRKSRGHPACQRDKLEAFGASLNVAQTCSICCHAGRDGNIYCSDGLFPPSSTLALYPDIQLPTTATVDPYGMPQDQVHSPVTNAAAGVQSSARPDVFSPEAFIKYPYPMACARCNIIDQKYFPSCDASTRCYGDKPLCMTSFYDDGHNKLMMVKRCAAASECWDLWYNKTRLNLDCMGDRDHDPYSWPGTKSGECHYCCHTPLGQEQDWCNKRMWPTKPRNLVDMTEYQRMILDPQKVRVTEKPSTSSQPSSTRRAETTTARAKEPPTIGQTPENQITTQQATVEQETTEETASTQPVQQQIQNQTEDVEPDTTLAPPAEGSNVTNESLKTVTEATVNTTRLAAGKEILTTVESSADSNVTKDAELAGQETTEPVTLYTTSNTTMPSTAVEIPTTSESEILPKVNQTEATVLDPDMGLLSNITKTHKTTDIPAKQVATTRTTKLNTATTTISLPKPVTSETTTPLAKPATTAAPARLRCEVCDDLTGQGQSCQSGRIELCADDKAYCMNTVSFTSAADGTLSTAVRKKCATFLNCQSSNINSADCYEDFTDSATVTAGTRCNFCCNETSSTGVPCNANARPEKTINFLSPKQAVTRSCHQCGDPASGKPCGPGDLLLGQSQHCPAGKDFCMNDIYEKAGSGRTIYKRCVDEGECRDKWFKESSDSNECADYDPRGAVTSDLTCHFCCTEDGCNRPTKPEESTLWTPFYAEC